MDEFWLEKARNYISEHNAFCNVSKVNYNEDQSIANISAIVSIGLPSRFIKKGITDTGVKSKEEVQFIFSEQFPLKAPSVILRSDFPRCFAHINPSNTVVSPCIYEGDLSELLQQSAWMNGILNQLVDWLEKAASNDLLNYDQGWEPMRNDNLKGFIIYDLDEVIKRFDEKKSLTRKINYEERKDLVITGTLCNPAKTKSAQIIYFFTPGIIDRYIPNSISNLSELFVYADSVGIQDVRIKIEEIDLGYIDEDKLFVVLCVRRPVNLIGQETNIEFLNFIIHKSKHRKKKKRLLPDCRVDLLSHISDSSPTLLKRLSGVNTKIDETTNIALVGCGSLGSKIGIHLARNGNRPFLCIDDDIFFPHNNARHALAFPWAQNKAELLSLSIRLIGKAKSEPFTKSALFADYTRSRVLIDTTGSLSVRNFLMSRMDLPPIISGGLYENGRYGLMLIENKYKTTRLVKIWAYLYYQSITNDSFREVLFSSDLKNVQIGQSCSSQTMVVDDARISLMAATMGLKIQSILENGFPDCGEILFVKNNDNYSLSSDKLSVPVHETVQSLKKRDWKVVLSKVAHDQMVNLLHEKAPNETGGVLVGSVFLFAKTIVISGIIPAPPDSVETKSLFILGTEGLEKTIKDIENKTNGKVTYLGTWHSHPFGGNASQTDDSTYKRLFFIRNYEPTVCLIVKQNEVILV